MKVKKFWSKPESMSLDSFSAESGLTCYVENHTYETLLSEHNRWRQYTFDMEKRCQKIMDGRQAEIEILQIEKENFRKALEKIEANTDHTQGCPNKSWPLYECDCVVSDQAIAREALAIKESE